MVSEDYNSISVDGSNDFVNSHNGSIHPSLRLAKSSSGVFPLIISTSLSLSRPWLQIHVLPVLTDPVR